MSVFGSIWYNFTYLQCDDGLFFLVFFLLALGSLRLSLATRYNCILVCMDQKDSYASRHWARLSSLAMFMAWFCSVRCISRCVPLFVGRPSLDLL